MHEMIMQERIHAREQEFSKIAENNRLLALLDEAPSRTRRIGNALKALFARSDKKIRNWNWIHRVTSEEAG